MNHREPVAREGWLFIGFFAFVTMLLYWAWDYRAALIGLVPTVFCIFFFRNPQRKTPAQEGNVVAPADGRIMDIMNMSEDKYIHANTIRVRIFLSLFSVHINRAPIAGQVEWVQKVSGIFLPAYKDEASHKNARNYLGLSTEWGRIMVVQITGIIARRLVCWVQPGDILETGQRFGLIRFGSCTEIYLPEDINILVEHGQKVKGGETLIARFYR
ncbi:MAG: phosphatidylserine decarboxylase family protein [Syntrophomonas sp.]|nr:phosphatidylserine decarboxylase family protein [Syntrophomonas sp.]